ncbi:sensor histidine kinase [Thalassobaculum litoreum]|uniref:histidine kinase n=1 Tax=Thalassobaculum litoreum DSM 18839 TaxID=1123362 RepID=A0A8G2BJN5_9PROT|nr:HAMP domain-containing sensor histidine kinase [Thalassobaculum litoreum]SDG08654.1 Signal transduction histidine kinase [Thalassobaculum litoreum DSM 18839]
MTAAQQGPPRDTQSTPPQAGRSTVTGRLFRTAFLLYLVAATVITGALVAETYFSARADLERELTLHQRTLERTLAGPLWSLDLDEVAKIAVAAADLPEIVGIRVLDHNQAGEFTRAGDLPEGSAGVGEAPGAQALPGQGLAVSFPVDYSHAVGSTRVGYVTLFSSELVILERLRWHIALLVIAALLKTAILWFIFDRVSRSILVRPLYSLVEATRRTGFDKLEPVEFDPATAKAAAGTEIETLRTAFNDMIGQLRRSRDALSVLNADLETRVGERTRELETRTSEASAATARVEQSRRQVAAALEEAERAARAKSEFLALVSHELRTPLNSVLGFSELIQRQVDTHQDDVKPAQISSYADAIHESGTQLLTLVNDILDLSRIEAGRMEVTPEWIDTAATTRTVVEMMRDPATKQRLSLEFGLGADTPMLKVDPRRYRQMLMNLLSNALKYTEAGGSIRIDGHRRPDGWLEIVVADTGVGIPASDIAIALEPFGRTGDPTTRRLAGAGLGLPLVARMMQLHGGRLAIESAVNAGTRVILRFPPSSVSNE